jgi:hypothetical protein
MMKTTLAKTKKAARRKMPSDLDKHKYHDKVIIMVGGRLIAVDEEIVSLIVLMNSLPGVATNACCQGDVGQQAYASLEGSDAFAFAFSIAEILAKTFVTHGIKLRVGEQMYTHNFTIEVGEALVMRWPPHTYPLVLQVAKHAVTQMGGGR